MSWSSSWDRLFFNKMKIKLIKSALFYYTIHFRRGLKATFLLVPLFGIQLFFITYRPPVEKANRLLYEIVSKVIIDSQVYFL